MGQSAQGCVGWGGVGCSLQEYKKEPQKEGAGIFGLIQPSEKRSGSRIAALKRKAFPSHIHQVREDLVLLYFFL